MALKEGFTVTKIDIKNAFNSIKREILIAALESHGINNKFIQYLLFYLKNRTCVTDKLGDIDGVP